MLRFTYIFLSITVLTNIVSCNSNSNESANQSPSYTLSDVSGQYPIEFASALDNNAIEGSCPSVTGDIYFSGTEEGAQRIAITLQSPPSTWSGANTDNLEPTNAPENSSEQLYARPNMIIYTSLDTEGTIQKSDSTFIGFPDNNQIIDIEFTSSGSALPLFTNEYTGIETNSDNKLILEGNVFTGGNWGGPIHSDVKEHCFGTWQIDFKN